MSKPNRTWIIPAALFLSTLAAYWTSFQVPFVFDDLTTIQRNSFVRYGQLGLAMYPRGLLFETFKLNSMLSGQEVWSYHLFNFLLHLLNGFLIFLIADRVFRTLGTNAIPNRGFAALAAAFFLLHPLQTESVTYISSRSELLSTLFYLTGLLVFAVWPVYGIGVLCGVAVGLIYVLGIGAKETAVTLPAAILLYDFLFLSKGRFRPIATRWRFYLLYLFGAAATIYYLLTVGLKDVVGSRVAGNLSSWHYFLTETRVLLRYIQLIFLPVGLNLDYDFRPSLTLVDPGVVISIVILLGLIYLGWRLRGSAPVFAFSIFWFFVTLSPTSSFISIPDVIFEHRMYLPMAGIALSFPLLIELMFRRHKSRVTAFACVLLAALMIGTVMRNEVWGDEVRLFADDVEKSPLKERPYSDLAFAYYKRGQYDRAVATLEEAIERIPGSVADLGDALGNMYLKQGQFDKGIEMFQKKIRQVGGEQLAISYNNLGMAYLYIWTDLENRQNQMTVPEFDSRKEQVLKPAADAFLNALRITPDMPSTLDSYINTMCWLGHGGELATAAAARLNAGENQVVQQFSALYTIGKVAFNNNDYAKADQYFELAEKIKDDIKIVYFDHGYALTRLNQDDRAIEKYTHAIQLEPIFIEAHYNLGLIYWGRKEYDKAIDSFTEVLRLEPNYVSAHLYLARSYAELGKLDLARGHIARVRSVSPGNQEAAAIAQQFGL